MLGTRIHHGRRPGAHGGASRRVVTETAKIAMPEIAIGLFPDVGATGFLTACRTPLACFWDSPAWT
ncbi:MAG: enoyl-CoA hydratase/isomerase family protein [Desulfobacterales bacterium]